MFIKCIKAFRWNIENKYTLLMKSANEEPPGNSLRV